MPRKTKNKEERNKLFFYDEKGFFDGKSLGAGRFLSRTIPITSLIPGGGVRFGERERAENSTSPVVKPLIYCCTHRFQGVAPCWLKYVYRRKKSHFSEVCRTCWSQRFTLPVWRGTAWCVLYLPSFKLLRATL